MYQGSVVCSRIACTLTVVAVLLSAPVLGALAWSRGTGLLQARTAMPDGAVLTLLALVGALASSYLAAGILVEFARATTRLSLVRRRGSAAPVCSGPSTVARRLVAGALGVGLVSTFGLPAFAGDEWNPGWQPATATASPTAPGSPTTSAGTSSVRSAPPPGAAVGTARSTVVVRAGDSLWRIAAEHLDPDASPAEIAAAWPGWYDANRGVVGTDPNLIHPGQVLARPVTDAAGQ